MPEILVNTPEGTSTVQVPDQTGTPAPAPEPTTTPETTQPEADQTDGGSEQN